MPGVLVKDAVVMERTRRGPLLSVEDLLPRVGKLNRRGLQKILRKPSSVTEPRRAVRYSMTGRRSDRLRERLGCRCLTLQPSGTLALRKIASELSRPVFAAASGVMSFVRPKTSTLSASL